MKFKVGDLVRVRGEDGLGTIGRSYLGYLGIVRQVKDTGHNQYYVLELGMEERWFAEKNLCLEEENKMDNPEKCCGEATSGGRGLYEVIVVNPTEDGEVVMSEKIVARDESEAKFQAGVKEILKAKKLRLGDVDIIVNRMGTVRPYATEQKVRIVGSIDGYKLTKDLN